jgi:hypothetical protein
MKTVFHDPSSTIYLLENGVADIKSQLVCNRLPLQQDFEMCGIEVMRTSG